VIVLLTLRSHHITIVCVLCWVLIIKI